MEVDEVRHAVQALVYLFAKASSTQVRPMAFRIRFRYCFVVAAVDAAAVDAAAVDAAVYLLSVQLLREGDWRAVVCPAFLS